MAKVTRRDFTIGVAGAAVGLAARSKAAGIEIGVQSYTYRKFDIDRMIASMRSVGLGSVELWDGHLDPAKTTDADFRAVRKKFDGAGIKISAYCVNFRPASTDELIDKSFRGAGLLGTNVMTASVQKPIVPRLDAYCVKHKVYLGLHNHWYGPSFKGDLSQEFDGPEDFEEALKGRSRYMSINLDVGHFSASGHDPVAYIREHHDRIVSLHIKDRDKDPERTNRRFGQGATPLREVARVLKEVHYKYAANLEFEIEENDPTEGVRDAFEYFKKALETA
ncbi:MAG TPA: sugar phosphate isomerase/epimerase [Vicinamibacteria bacterium]|jgi:sugar phosphate isomerase/epimerase